MEEEKKITTKKELKQKAQEMKLEEKQRKLEEKQAIKEEKERRKNSFGRKVRNFFLLIVLIIVLLLVGFYFGKQFLTEKEKELNDKKMSQTYQTAMVAFNEKDYKKALEILKSIDETYSKYSEVKNKINEIEQLYLNEYLLKADEYLKVSKYDRALEVLADIDEDLQDSELIENKRNEIKIALLKYEVSELVSNEEDILSILEYIVDFDSNNSIQIEDAKEELIAQYKSEFLLETRTLMQTDYSKAKNNIAQAKKLLPNDKDIKKLEEELTSIEPTSVNLLSLKSNVTKGKLTVSNGDNKITSMDNNVEYDKYILKSASKSGNNHNSPYTIEFDLNKDYTELKGIICTQANDNGTKQLVFVPKVTFYDGDKVIYYTDNVTDSTFSVDVTGVEKLTIEFEGITTEDYFIANPELTPVK